MNHADAQRVSDTYMHHEESMMRFCQQKKI